MINIKYEKLWTDSPLPTQNPRKCISRNTGDFVTTDDGTGIVHTAPTFGADDMIAAQNAKPEVPPMLILNKDGDLSPLVDLQGKFIDGLGSISGKYVKNQYYNEKDVPEKSVDVEIAIKLKEENKAFRVEKYTHSYPNCWRTDKPILYYPLNSWFVAVTKRKSDLIQYNKKSIGNQSPQELEDLEIGLKMQMIGIYQDLDIGEFLYQFGAQRMVKKY